MHLCVRLCLHLFFLYSSPNPAPHPTPYCKFFHERNYVLVIYFQLTRISHYNINNFNWILIRSIHFSITNVSLIGGRRDWFCVLNQGEIPLIVHTMFYPFLFSRLRHIMAHSEILSKPLNLISQMNKLFLSSAWKLKVLTYLASGFVWQII